MLYTTVTITKCGITEQYILSMHILPSKHCQNIFRRSSISRKIGILNRNQNIELTRASVILEKSIKLSELAIILELL